MIKVNLIADLNEDQQKHFNTLIDEYLELLGPYKHRQELVMDEKVPATERLKVYRQLDALQAKILEFLQDSEHAIHQTDYKSDSDHQLICKECGHRGMIYLRMEVALMRDEVKCPACGHEALVHINTSAWSHV